MESFKGNGAECMVQFIKDGCKGRVMADIGTKTPLEMISKKTRYAVSAMCSHSLDWLAMPCEYYPPEPVYRNATPGEALDAWFRGKTVQRRADTLDDAIADGEWYDIGPRYSDMPFSRWSVQETRYRIKEE